MSRAVLGPRYFFIVMLSVLSIPLFAQHAAAYFSAGKARFAVKVNEKVLPYQVNGVFVLPGEKLTLKPLDVSTQNAYVLQNVSGLEKRSMTNEWQWQAPQKPGLYTLALTRLGSMDSVTLNIFVMVPFQQGAKKQHINGYRIGAYPRRPTRPVHMYNMPRGFIEVTEENQETFIAPHFQLKQFVCKQNGSYPKYIVLREQLLWKLEAILEKINIRGYRYNTFHVMSGYRTPSYNKSIGNVKHSRHLWGDAADIFVDAYPQDGKMDDLNRDGKINRRDAALLYKIIDGMYGPSSSHQHLIGGLGQYSGTAAHGPFVHVDVRGHRVRWKK